MTKPLLIALAASAALAQTPLRVSMIALGVKDPARSVAFYRDTLGMEMVGPAGEVTLVKAGEITIALNQPLGRAASGAMVGAVEVIFQVPSVAAAHADLTKRGCSFAAAPHEVYPGMWAATFTDPDGHRLTVLGPK